jgi:hypothetical protein
MTIKAALFDGTVLQFPDGTSPDVIKRVAKAETEKRKAKSQPQQDQSGLMLPPRADAPASPVQPAPVDTLTDTAGSMMEAPLEAAGAFAGGLTGGPSPARNYFANDPLTKNLPDAALTVLGGVGDAAGAALSTMGAGLAGGIGLLTELVPGQDPREEAKLGSDLLTASQMAVPELAGASSVALTAGRGATRAATEIPKPKATVVTVAAPRSSDDIAVLANKAARGGMGSTKAMEELAAEAQINPAAKEAADRLGIDLPVDVFSDSLPLKENAGRPRGITGSEASGEWLKTVDAARTRADGIMAEMDGAPDLASVSDKIKASLSSTRDDLQKEAKKLFTETDASLPPATRIEMLETTKLMNTIIEEMGGVSGLSKRETELYDMITNPKDRPTYGRLVREKNIIGEAIGRGKSPYENMDIGAAKRLYKALSEDQLAAQPTADLRAKLRMAHQLTTKQKALEKRIVSAFGSDLDGGIGLKLRTAVNNATKGDAGGLTRILKTIPEDLRKEALTTALSSMSRQNTGAGAGSFGLAQFSKTWAGLSQNKPIVNAIGAALGPEAMATLDDLANVSRRISEANDFISKTGRANQALVGPLSADGLVTRIMTSQLGDRAARAAGTAVGAATAGIGGAIVGSETASAALNLLKGDNLAAVGKLFRSKEFMDAALEAQQTGKLAPQTASRLAQAPAFIAWAKKTGVAPVDFVNSMLSAPLAVPTGVASGAAANDNRPWLQLKDKY